MIESSYSLLYFLGVRIGQEKTDDLAWTERSDFE